MSLSREPGFYWVRWGFLAGPLWEPAQYCLDGNYDEPYWRIHSQNGIIVSDAVFAEIGDRIFPPYPMGYS